MITWTTDRVGTASSKIESSFTYLLHLSSSTSSIRVECLFSTAGLVANTNRSSLPAERLTRICFIRDSFNPLTGTLKPQSSGSIYRNMVIGTLAVDGWLLYLVQRGWA